MSNLPSRETFEVHLGEVDYFGTPPTHEGMVREFEMIGSAEAWAKRCGEQLQHGEQVWKAVSEMIILGTQHKDANDRELQGIQILCPTASAATWWIFCRSEFCGDVGPNATAEGDFLKRRVACRFRQARDGKLPGHGHSFCCLGCHRRCWPARHCFEHFHERRR